MAVDLQGLFLKKGRENERGGAINATKQIAIGRRDAEADRKSR